MTKKYTYPDFSSVYTTLDTISHDSARHSAEHADMLHQLQELHLKTGEALALLKELERAEE